MIGHGTGLIRTDERFPESGSGQPIKNRRARRDMIEAVSAAVTSALRRTSAGSTPREGLQASPFAVSHSAIGIQDWRPHGDSNPG